MHLISENEESKPSSGSTPLTALTVPQLNNLGNTLSIFLYREEKISKRLRNLLLAQGSSPWFALLTESEDRTEKAGKALEMVKKALKKKGVVVA